ncbi:MAG: type VI secretion system baseplate subunit TssG [Campylobacterota bacterium]|nr:type VI secretion system baseplate subunit TssG [Campylobacterota bacterium]
MEATIGRQEIDLKEQLLTQSSEFSFVQALRLLLLQYDDKEQALRDAIRVRPRLSLDFPHSDIIDIVQRGDIYQLTVTFLGLYGESSPLPTFYTETLLEEEARDTSVMRDFIDIFNGPIYESYFKVWLKNRLGVRFDEFGDQSIIELFHVFSGMPTRELRDKHKVSYALLKYAGLTLHNSHSALGLSILIRDVVSWEQVHIVQCVEQMVAIPQEQYCLLGESNSILDETLHLGEKIRDRMGKFRIVIEELDADRFNHLLPGGELFDTLVQAIVLYLNEPLDWDIQLILARDAYHTVTLGKKPFASLGYNTWLGVEDNREEYSIILHRDYYRGVYDDKATPNSDLPSI